MLFNLTIQDHTSCEPLWPQNREGIWNPMETRAVNGAAFNLRRPSVQKVKTRDGGSQQKYGRKIHNLRRAHSYAGRHFRLYKMYRIGILDNKTYVRV
jgi:hypothetical protein